MTASNFAAALKFVLAQEGGYSNHPQDPGGATQRGITQAVYDAFRQAKGQPPKTVYDIADAELNAIYKRQYWQAIHGDDLPDGVDLAVFDYAVNSGPGKAVKDLQRALGTNVDGIVGVRTLALADAGDSAKIIREVCRLRLAFLKRLKTWKTFGKGWGRRVAAVEVAALAMCHGRTPAAPAPPVGLSQAAKAPEAAQAQLKTPEGQGLTIAAAGVGGEKVRQFAETVQPHMGVDTILGRAAFAVFTLLTLLGGLLIAYAYIKRIKEAGGLGGFIGSVFKG